MTAAVQKVTVTEAIRLIETKKARLHELLEERGRSASVSYREEDKEYVQWPERTVEEISDEVRFVQKQLRDLTWALSKANTEIKSGFTLDGEELHLGQLVSFLQQARTEQKQLEHLGKLQSKKVRSKERQHVANEWTWIDYFMVEDVLFDTAEMKKRADELKKTIDKAQLTVDRLNITHEIDFVDAEYEANA